LPVKRTELKSTGKQRIFNWEKEARSFDIFNLISVEDKQVHGLMSLKRFDEYNFVFISLIERAGYKSGLKLYEGVTQNLVAFACQTSFDAGLDGFVSFESKTELFGYYTRILGAVRIGNSSRMYIHTENAQQLIKEWL
jgi:hypothetical protein